MCTFIFYSDYSGMGSVSTGDPESFQWFQSVNGRMVNWEPGSDFTDYVKPYR